MKTDGSTGSRETFGRKSGIEAPIEKPITGHRIKYELEPISGVMTE